MQQQMEQARITLEYQGQQIEHQIEEMDESLQEGGENWTDYALRQRMRSQLDEKMRRIASAKQRIDEGRYGQCSICGMSIDPERLNILPEAMTCVHCTQKTARQHFKKMRQAHRCRSTQ